MEFMKALIFPEARCPVTWNELILAWIRSFSKCLDVAQNCNTTLCVSESGAFKKLHSSTKYVRWHYVV